MNTEVSYTPEFKLKDNSSKKEYVINLEKQFGFIPKVIIIEKVHGANNKIRLGAVDNKFIEKRERALRAEKVKKAREAKKDVQR